MITKKLFALAGAVALLASGSLAAHAQGTGTKPATGPAPAHGMPGHSMPGHSTGIGKSSAPVTAGKIIGNKNTKIYHLAGDTGNMPLEKNRVYFKTEAEAKAAGYKLATPEKAKATDKKPAPARDPKTGRFIKK